jgi:hypothetical protein
VADRLDVDAVRAHLLGERRDLLATVGDCADAVAAGWDGAATTDPDAVPGPLRTTLERAGVLSTLPAVLRECVAVAGGKLQAEPVAASPYVVVTSRGPVLRATLAAGRLVVTLQMFTVERAAGGGARYSRDERPAGASVTVAVRGRRQ